MVEPKVTKSSNEPVDFPLAWDHYEIIMIRLGSISVMGVVVVGSVRGLGLWWCCRGVGG